MKISKEKGLTNVIIAILLVVLVVFTTGCSSNILPTGAAVVETQDNTQTTALSEDDSKIEPAFTNEPIVNEKLLTGSSPKENEGCNPPCAEGNFCVNHLGSYECRRLGGGGGGGLISNTQTDSSSDSIQEVAWEDVYSYSDEYSRGGFFIDAQNNQIEVSRAYVWRAEFGTIFNGKIQVVSSNDGYSWYGSRLALVDPSNLLVRYEIRLLPSENKLEVRYVDRTNRTGVFNGIDSNTVSEQLTATNCDIKTGTWYDINIIKDGTVWKAQLLSLTNPTCFVEWEDDRIVRDKFAIGIQSAGKYVISRFDTLVAI